MSLPPSQVAALGEELAAQFLRRRGARIVERNLRVGRREIDILAELGGQRVAVEVKTRRSGDGRDSFTLEKAASVRTAARAVKAYRVDLVAVSLGEHSVDIRWLPDV